MTRRLRASHVTGAAFILAGLVSACGGDDTASSDTSSPTSGTGGTVTTPPASSPPPGTEPPESTEPPGTEPPSTDPPETTDPNPGPPVEKEVSDAMDDLAKRLGVDRSEIVASQPEEVTWRTSALGCSKQGMMYLQVLTSGRRLILTVDGKDYAYHSGGGKPFFYCRNPDANEPYEGGGGGGGGDI